MQGTTDPEMLKALPALVLLFDRMAPLDEERLSDPLFRDQDLTCFSAIRGLQEQG